MVGYEFLEHTADICARVYADTKEDLFESAACALFSLIIDHTPVSETSKKIHLKSETIEDLLVNWLGELISLLFAKNFLPSKYEISIKQDENSCVLDGVVSGQRFNPFEQDIKTEVKAATYHNLHILQKQGQYQVDIVFDV
jgi:protein archease